MEVEQEQLVSYWRQQVLNARFGESVNLIAKLPRVQQKIPTRKRLPSRRIHFCIGDGHELTTREYQCVVALLHCFSIRKISQHLDLSERTVEYYLGLVRKKLGCKTKLRLIRYLQRLPLDTTLLDQKIGDN